MQSVYIFENDVSSMRSEYELKCKLESMGMPFKNPILLDFCEDYEYIKETVYGKDEGISQDEYARFIKFSWRKI